VTAKHRTLVVTLRRAFDGELGDELDLPFAVFVGATAGAHDLEPMPFGVLGPRFRTATIDFTGTVWMDGVEQEIDLVLGVSGVPSAHQRFRSGRRRAGQDWPAT
jgi:hypothetical protein